MLESFLDHGHSHDHDHDDNDNHENHEHNHTHTCHNNHELKSSNEYNAIGSSSTISTSSNDPSKVSSAPPALLVEVKSGTKAKSKSLMQRLKGILYFRSFIHTGLY